MRFHKGYFASALLLFAIEVLIALYVHDGFVRPYLGDTLVVMLLYCAIRAVSRAKALAVAIGVLLFAFGIELLQYADFIGMMGWEDAALARTVIGHSAAWEDIAAYGAGFFAIVLAEKYRKEI